MVPPPAAAIVLEHLPVGIVVLDSEGRVASRNSVARRLLGPMPDSGTSRCCDLLGCGRPGTPLERGCIAETVAPARRRRR